MQFIDTHTHLYAEQFNDDIAAVVKRAMQQNVHKLLLPDIDSTTRPAMMAMHTNYPTQCLVMIGLHPTSVKEDYKTELELIDDCIDKHPFCGIGETGIDLYWDKTFIEQQIDSFTYQVALALKHHLPLVIHARKSLNEIFAVLAPFKNKGLTGVFHCFPGNIAEAQHAIDLGFHLGIGGVVTYKNSGMAEVVKHFGLEHFVLETDSPYLSPAPERGKRNESANVPIIAAFIAQLKNCALAQVAETTTRNAEKLFKIKA
ncbi:MAG: TatD family hydrolase [Bacteroidota bacterium]